MNDSGSQLDGSEASLLQERGRRQQKRTQTQREQIGVDYLNKIGTKSQQYSEILIVRESDVGGDVDYASLIICS